MIDGRIEFVGKILDNVHGFIEYTKAEDKIMRLLLFKRLQSIKQLSLVNWVFPGSEHTRFIHSLGVMHIAYKIASQLELPYEEQKIVRLAGLLHDIGHYPLSHVCEFPYRRKMLQIGPGNYCKQVNQQIIKEIADYDSKPEVEFMRAAKPGHHEEIGALVIKSNPEIRSIIADECGEEAIETICDMITGNVERDNPRTCLLVQILHSELDADGIDYMLRDAVFSGTSFGSFEVDQLIRSMTSVEYNRKYILCITPKAIAAADQYLINKFFSYSQVVFNKHTIVLEWMAEQIVSWMQENATYFPRKETLRNKWIKDTNSKSFLDFTDNFFWSSIKSITENPAHETFPPYILELCKKLLHHQELPFVEGSEYKIVSRKNPDIKALLQSSAVYKQGSVWDSRITVLNTREITKHIPHSEYNPLIIMPEETESKLSSDEFNQYLDGQNMLRLMDGICVCDSEEVHLLCDDKRSLMQQLWGTKLVVMRSYAFE